MGNDPPEAALLRRGTSRPAAYGPRRFLVIVDAAQAGGTARLDQETGLSGDGTTWFITDKHIPSDGRGPATTGDHPDHDTIEGPVDARLKLRPLHLPLNGAGPLPVTSSLWPEFASRNRRGRQANQASARLPVLTGDSSG